MDVNQDGAVDLLSGSYCVNEGPEIGAFHVFHGDGKGGFRKPVMLAGTDGQYLSTGDRPPYSYCTRPTAVDLDGDGALDIVAGNFSGEFWLFRGQEGGGFSSTRQQLLDGEGNPMKVDGKGDPFFVDWDGDGDLDLLSGSSKGAVVWFRNDGTRTEPCFAPAATLLEAFPGGKPDPGVYGIGAFKGPGHRTRIWAGDVDGDGTHDLLVGDQVTVRERPRQYTEAELARHEAVQAEIEEVREAIGVISRAMFEAQKKAGDTPIDETPYWEKMDPLRERMNALHEQLPPPPRATGFVWFFKGRPAR